MLDTLESVQRIGETRRRSGKHFTTIIITDVVFYYYSYYEPWIFHGVLIITGKRWSKPVPFRFVYLKKQRESGTELSCYYR